MRLAATRSSIAALRAPGSGGDCADAGANDQTPRTASAASAGLLGAAPARRMAVNIIVSLLNRPGRLTQAGTWARAGEHNGSTRRFLFRRFGAFPPTSDLKPHRPQWQGRGSRH